METVTEEAKNNTEDPSISILMSIYKNDNPEYLRQAIDSMIVQTYPADEFVIVEDGPLSSEVYEVLNVYQRQYPSLFKFIKLENNQGLGIALGLGLRECRNALVARMDSDDISCRNRLELEVQEFIKDPSLDVVGGIIEEFDGELTEVVSKRIVPLTQKDIYNRTKTRSPFNHVTVMMKKNAVLSVGNYPKVRYAQDYYLWVEMINAGLSMKNIDRTLVYVRTGKDMFKRRGGQQYFELEKELQNKMLEYRIINRFEWIRNLLIRGLIRKMGSQGRQYIYIHFLRN